MKSYKLNKTLENTTYPIEQELKNLNKSTQTSALKTILTVSTVIFSGAATSFIYENRLFESEIDKFLNDLREHNIVLSLDQFFVYALALIYVLCIVINLIIYFVNRYKVQPKNMKKSKYGREKLAENFHKSIINDIVVGLSFLDKTNENGVEEDIKNMYLYEATYYFLQAENQIEQMKIFDDTKETVNEKLVEKIGRETFFTMLNVFQNGVNSVMDKMSMTKPEKEEYKALKDIYEKLQIHINLLK